MLQGRFFTIDSFSDDCETLKATIVLNSGHEIFKGHFPGQPVVPGVCMMQIVRELMERAAGSRLRIVNGENLKFLSIINPVENTKVEVLINFSRDSDFYKINAAIFSGQVTFFKFKGGFHRL